MRHQMLGLLAVGCFGLLVSGQTTVFVPTVPCVGAGCNITTEPPTSTTTEQSTTLQRTVVFVKKETLDGQDLFIRGGISDTVRPICVNAPNVAETDPCAISIQVLLDVKIVK